MAKKKKQPSLTDEELMGMINGACKKFEGDTYLLESAIGALVWGRVVGWHALRLMHSSRTFKRYEEVFGVKFREVLPAQTDQSERMRGIKLMNDAGKFWQVITAGLIPAKEAAIAEPA